MRAADAQSGNFPTTSLHPQQLGANNDRVGMIPCGVFSRHPSATLPFPLPPLLAAVSSNNVASLVSVSLLALPTPPLLLLLAAPRHAVALTPLAAAAAAAASVNPLDYGSLTHFDLLEGSLSLAFDSLEYTRDIVTSLLTTISPI